MVETGSLSTYEKFLAIAGARKDALAIVGSHPNGREGVPWDDDNVDICLFNEAAMKVEKYPRWSMLLQIHSPDIYTSLDNWVNRDHWAWLQQDHGKPIWMQDVDPRVPNSLRYPLEEILSWTPYRYLRSSPAMALALGIWLGYPKIMIFGSELTSNTEYFYQASNLAFWVGYAHGLGVDLEMRCWQSEFWQPIYGYEGEYQLPANVFEQRRKMYETAWHESDRMLAKMRDQFMDATLRNDYDKVAQLIVEMGGAALAAGEASGAMGEAERYAAKMSPISRQEFERTAARAGQDYSKRLQDMYHLGGICEYIYNGWRQSGRVDVLNQLRTKVRDQVQAAYDAGIQRGINAENTHYLLEYDKRLLALGGTRAIREIGNREV